MSVVGGGEARIDPQEFRRVLGHYPTGVTVVAATTPGGPEGMTIGSFTSVSLDPPLVSFAAGQDSESWAKMRDAGSFCVNVLAAEQSGTSTVFASKVTDRFAGVSTRSEATGSPVIEGCLAWIDCRTSAIHLAGDHEIVLGEVVAMGTAADVDAMPLVFFKGRYWRVSEP